MWFRLLRLVPPVHLPEVTLLSRHHAQQGFRTRRARQEAAQLWVNLMEEIREDEILSCAPSREAFFVELGRSFCEIDLRLPHDYAWARAGRVQRLRYAFSIKRHLKRCLRALRLLGIMRRYKMSILGRL